MPVYYALKDHVATVTIDRPEVMNALDAAAERDLENIWRAIEADRNVRVVVFTGSGGRAFCTGADLKNAEESGPLTYWASQRPNGFGGISLRESLDVPIIARVNGHAIGGGFEMLLNCDLVVAADTATFGLPEPRIGRMPLDGGMILLQRRVPFRAAMALLLTGRRVPAPEALRLGIVNEVVPAKELDAAVERWVADVLACAPLALRAIKQATRRAATLGVADAVGLKTPALIEALTSSDAQEGVQAFREKRKPEWRGK